MEEKGSRWVDEICEFALSAPVVGVRIIGVDGPSGAGKSTLALSLASRLGAALIHIDDFVSWNNFSGWWDRFEDQVLSTLLSGQDATYQQRDWAGDEFGDGLAGWRTVQWSPVVVIEGVTCSRAEASNHLACRVWMETPAAERLRRGLERDGDTHRDLWHRWMIEEDAFFERDNTRERADFVVSGVA
jgi:uridine kinase